MTSEVMHVEQAMFTSANARQLGHCDLVARSPGVDDGLAKKLMSWTPAFWDLNERQTESLNFYLPMPDRLVLCRSVYARSEYGRAEGGRLITLAVIFEPAQLVGYEYNVVLFATTLRSMGLLTLPTDPSAKLGRLEVPAWTLLTGTESVAPLDSNTSAKILRAIDIHKKVAIFGRIDPLQFLCSLLAQIPVERRWQISFSTALKVSEMRPFHLHFFPAENPDLKKELVQAQVRTMTLEPSEIPASFARAW
jgi:hypothetical protein